MKTFEDRVEEVLGELHGMAWPLLDEPQKRKIVGKVARGVDLGDTIAAWARALGMDRSWLSRQLDHFRRSEPIDGRARRDAETIRKKVQAAKNVLKDEQLLDELLEDRQAATTLAKAAIRHQNKVESEVNAETKRRAPGLVHKLGWNEVVGELIKARRSLASGLEQAKELDLTKDEAGAFSQQLDEIEVVIDWFRSFLKSGNADFDTELQQMLEGR